MAAVRNLSPVQKFISRIFRSLTYFVPKLPNYGLSSGNVVMKPLVVPGGESPMCPHGQVRTHFANWRQLKDHRRRKTVAEYYPRRMRLNCIRKNKVLPREIQEIADKEIDALPRDSNAHRLRNRCMLTSRPRGNLTRWRLSRIMWRHFADYNQLSGVTRSCW